MDKHLERELQRYRKVLERTRAIRCRMIDVDMPVSEAKRILNIRDWGMFTRGEYEDWQEMAEKLEHEMKKYPTSMIQRDKEYKTLKKALFMRGLSIHELEELIQEKYYTILRVVRGITDNPDLKRKVEKELEVRF